MKTSKKQSSFSGFEYNVQELATILRQKQKNIAIQESLAAKYEFELHGYHSDDVSLTASYLGSDLTVGLTGTVAELRLEELGQNIFTPKRDWPDWAKIIIGLFSGFNLILWICVVIALLAWQPLGRRLHHYYGLILALILFFFILLSGVFDHFQEHRVSYILQNLARRDVRLMCRVIRDAKACRINVIDLVVGDIVLLETGDSIPADVRIVECNDLRVYNSLLTGETHSIRLTSVALPETVSYLEAWNIAFEGSTVVQGSGKGIVIATGSQTQFAKVAQSSSLPSVKPTVVQEALRSLIVYASIGTCIILVTAIVFWAIYIRTIEPEYRSFSNLFIQLTTFVFAVVPLCMPFASTVGIIFIARRAIQKFHVLVKQFGNLTVLGSVNMLICDKTGALTQDKAYVATIITATSLTTSKFEETKLHDIPSAAHIINASYRVAAFCTEARLQLDTETHMQPEDIETGRATEANVTYSAVGSNAVDRCLLQWVKFQINLSELSAAYTTKIVLPFNSFVKMSAAVIAVNATNDAMVLVKGAPELIVARCSHFMDVDGVGYPMTEAIRMELMQLIDTEAGKCRSVIALAQSGPLSLSQYPVEYDYRLEPEPNFPMTGLTFISCAAIADPLANGVVEAVHQLRRSGILTILVTGDTVATAMAVAREVGIWSDIQVHSTVHTLQSLLGDVANSDVTGTSMLVQGNEVDVMSALEWDYVFKHNEIVFARTSPAQKLQIVQECQLRNFIVGVTGDGLNDCPAMAEADVGIAVNRGADVTKEVAKVVLLDDNFSTIVHGVREGRIKFDNMRKVIAFLMAGAFWGRMLPLVVAFFLGLPQPMSAFVIVIDSALCDVYGALALMFEGQDPGGPDVMTQPPRMIAVDPLVNWSLVFYSFGYGILITLGAFYNYFHYWLTLGYSSRQLLFSWFQWVPEAFLNDPLASYEHWLTSAAIFFVTLAIGQLFHLLSIRRKTPYMYSVIMAMRVSTPERASAYDENGAHYETSLCTELWSRSFLSAWCQCPIFYAWILTIATMFFFLNIPTFHTCCRTAVVPEMYWGMAIGWAVLWFVLFEIRKWIMVLFPNSWFARYCGW